MRGAADEPRADRRVVPIGVAAVAWVVTIVAAFVGAGIVYAATGHSGEDLRDLPFGVIGLSLLIQWSATLAVLWYVSRRHLTGRPLADYRLRFRPLDALGVPIGVLAQLVLIELLYWPLREWFPGTFSRHDVERPARELTDPAHGGWKVALVIAVVVCAPVVEETLYRGLILRSLDARIADGLALVVSALWFAGAHFQGVQFVGLFAFGLVLGACLQRTGRLGMGILAHAAFNATSLALLW